MCVCCSIDTVTSLLEDYFIDGRYVYNKHMEHGAVCIISSKFLLDIIQTTHSIPAQMTNTKSQFNENPWII